MRKIPRWLFSSAVLLSVAGVAFQTELGGLEGRSALASIVTQPILLDQDMTSSRSVTYRLAALERRPIVERIQATGTVMPVALLSVGGEVSGQIKEIYADFNQAVKSGEALALIDPLNFQIAVEHAEAQLGISLAQVTKSEIALREARSEFERKETLANRETITKAELEKAWGANERAAAELEEARQNVLAANASLRQAQADLERTVIRSPVVGTIITRNAELGQASMTPNLFTIAQKLHNMLVHVSIPEAEIGRVRVSQAVEFSVDSYKGLNFEGKVVQIRKHPHSTQNVVTYTVVADASNPDLLLLPGMTATASIIIDSSEEHLAVPNNALRFRLPGEAYSDQARIFVARDGKALPIPVLTGASDGAFTAITVIANELKEGEPIITGIAAETHEEASSPSRRLLGIF